MKIIVQIYGVYGVGKTTLCQKIQEKLKSVNTKSFPFKKVSTKFVPERKVSQDLFDRYYIQKEKRTGLVPVAYEFQATHMTNLKSNLFKERDSDYDVILYDQHILSESFYRAVQTVDGYYDELQITGLANEQLNPWEPISQTGTRYLHVFYQLNPEITLERVLSRTEMGRESEKSATQLRDIKKLFDMSIFMWNTARNLVSSERSQFITIKGEETPEILADMVVKQIEEMMKRFQL